MFTFSECLFQILYFSLLRRFSKRLKKIPIQWIVLFGIHATGPRTPTWLTQKTVNTVFSKGLINKVPKLQAAKILNVKQLIFKKIQYKTFISTYFCQSNTETNMNMQNSRKKCS